MIGDIDETEGILSICLLKYSRFSSFTYLLMARFVNIPLATSKTDQFMILEEQVVWMILGSEDRWQRCLQIVNKVMVRNVDLDLFG